MIRAFLWALLRRGDRPRGTVPYIIANGPAAREVVLAAMNVAPGRHASPLVAAPHNHEGTHRAYR